MNWGKWIIASFIVFAAFIAALVTVCMRQDISLVSSNYYQEELAYQQQIARMNNTALLPDKPVIRKAGNHIEINFKHFNILESGKFNLFRPSNAKMDKQFKVEQTDEPAQLFDISGMQHGMYRARLQWTMNGKEFFFEQVIYI